MPGAGAGKVCLVGFKVRHWVEKAVALGVGFCGLGLGFRVKRGRVSVSGSGERPQAASEISAGFGCFETGIGASRDVRSNNFRAVEHM